MGPVSFATKRLQRLISAVFSEGDKTTRLRL
jgi:hypothetical protein